MNAPSGLKELEILVQKMCVCLIENFDATGAPRTNVHLVILFLKIMNQIVYLKRALAICKTCHFITLQRNINFQFVPF